MGKRLLVVVTVVLSVGAIGIAAGCGDDEDESADSAATTSSTTAADSGGGGETSVAMTEYEFEPSDLSVAAGDTIALTNDGQVPHNMTIVEGEPTGGGAEVAASDDLAGGESGSFAVDAEPGDYGFLCTIPGHAEDGMVGTIKVE